jgi:hypothetical protein
MKETKTRAKGGKKDKKKSVAMRSFRHQTPKEKKNDNISSLPFFFFGGAWQRAAPSPLTCSLR